MKVVQITDLHLGADPGFCMAEWPGRPTLASLSLVLDAIQRTVPDLDALVVTGDVADSGLDEQAYFTLRSELARRGGSLLKRTHVIPGNHDRRAPLLAAFPVCEASGAEGEPELSFSASVCSGGEEWRLVGLDSGGASYGPPSHSGPPGLFPSQLR